MKNFFEIWVAENDSVAIEYVGSNTEEYKYCTYNGKLFGPYDNLRIINHNNKGRLYDWSPGWSWCPFVTEKIKNDLSQIFGNNVQWIGPFEFGQHTLFSFNCINKIDATTPESNYNRIFWKYENIENYNIFRPASFSKLVFVSEEIKTLIEKNRYTGIRFGEIDSDGWRGCPFI